MKISSHRMSAPPVPLKPHPTTLHQQNEQHQNVEEQDEPISIPTPLPRRFHSMRRTERPVIPNRSIYKVSKHLIYNKSQ